jgi:hypothetical protein
LAKPFLWMTTTSGTLPLGWIFITWQQKKEGNLKSIQGILGEKRPPNRHILKEKKTKIAIFAYNFFLMSSLTCSQVWLNPLADDWQPTDLTKSVSGPKFHTLETKQKSTTKYTKGFLPKKNRTKLTIFWENKIKSRHI